MNDQLRQWRDDGKHLPEIMKDFHDCKRVFKGIHDYFTFPDDHPAADISWRDAHIYVIDVFLWFMAEHGYTLQRSRAKQNFSDLGALLEQLDEQRNQALSTSIQGQGTPE